MDSIVKQIESVLRKDFAPFIAERLNVDSSEIDGYISEWLGKPAKKTTTTKQSKPTILPAPSTGAKPDASSLDTMTVADLRKLCEKHGLAKSGAKIALIGKLKEVMEQDVVEDKPMFEETPPKEQAKKKPTKSKDHAISESEEEEEQVVVPKKKKQQEHKSLDLDEQDEPQPKKRMLNQKTKKTKTTDKSSKPKMVEKIERTKIVLTTDEYGHSYDEQTGFVFDNDNQVIGKKDTKGNVLNLTKDDIELCKENHMEYVVPFNTEEDDE